MVYFHVNVASETRICPSRDCLPRRGETYSPILPVARVFRHTRDDMLDSTLLTL